MNAKHQFKYTYTDTDIAEISPVDVTFDMPGDVTITQMLYNFECYLKACGFVFDGRLEMVEDGYENYLDELDEEPQGGCMADFDKDEEAEEYSFRKWNKDLRELEERIKDKRAEELKETEERWNKLNHDQKMKIYKDSLKESEDVPFEPLYKKVGTLEQPDPFTVTNEQYEKESREAHKKEVKKNKWFHGMCNPPAADYQATKKNK